MSADEELARMEHKRLNGSSRLTARARRAPSAPTLQAVLRQRTETTDTTTPMDTDDDSYPAPDSALQSQTKEDTKPKVKQPNKRMKVSDGTASSIQSPTGSIQQQPRPDTQVLPVPNTDPCFAKAAAALNAACKSSSIKLFYMGIPESLKISTPQSIATRQLLAAHLNSVYDFRGIKCGKGLNLKVLFVDATGKTDYFPAMSSAYHWQDGKEVLPDGTSWQNVSSKATAIYVCQDEYANLRLPDKGVLPLSKLQQLNLHAPPCH